LLRNSHMNARWSALRGRSGPGGGNRSASYIGIGIGMRCPPGFRAESSVNGSQFPCRCNRARRRRVERKRASDAGSAAVVFGFGFGFGFVNIVAPGRIPCGYPRRRPSTGMSRLAPPVAPGTAKDRPARGDVWQGLETRVKEKPVLSIERSPSLRRKRGRFTVRACPRSARAAPSVWIRVQSPSAAKQEDGLCPTNRIRSPISVTSAASGGARPLTYERAGLNHGDDDFFQPPS